MGTNITATLADLGQLSFSFNPYYRYKNNLLNSNFDIALY